MALRTLMLKKKIDETRKALDKAMEKRTELEGQEARILSITKNRLTGRLGEVKLFYSEDSKRIVGEDKNFNKDYFNENSFVDAEAEQYSIPFEE